MVTVGLGLSIPLSIIGQMILASQHSSPAYWFGALFVLASFIFISSEESRDEEKLSASVHNGRDMARSFFEEEDRDDHAARSGTE